MVAHVADQVFIPFTVGGGVRSPEDARMLLELGADKVSLNTSAVETPDVITACAKRFGNQNISCIGPFEKPKAMLLGFRGAPGNTLNHPTSYWIPNHSPRSFVEKVDVVTGVGYDRAAELGEVTSRFHEIRRVISNLGVFDFETPDHSMRLASVHPGVSVQEVVENTAFELSLPDTVAETRAPSDQELRLIREVLDPKGIRNNEVPA